MLAFVTTSAGLGYFYKITRQNVWNELAERLADMGRTGQFIFSAEHRRAIDRLNELSEKDSSRNKDHLSIGPGESISVISGSRVHEIEKSDDFILVVQALRQIKNASRKGMVNLGILGQEPWPKDDPPRVRFTYLLVPIPEVKDRSILKFIADADYEAGDENGNGKIDPEEEASEIGKLYNVSAQPGLMAAFDGKVRTSEEYYEDQWGKWMSAYVPILRADGSVAAVMGIDMSATSQFNLLEKLYYICIAVIGGSVVLAIILSLALSRLIASPIVALRAGAERVKARDYSTQIVVKSKDELGILASTFNDMVREVRTYATTLEDRVKERTAELNESRGQMSDILRNIQEGILTIDRSGKVNSEYSGRVPDMLGKQPEGLEFADLFPAQLQNSVRDFVGQLIENPFMSMRMFVAANPLSEVRILSGDQEKVLSFSFSRVKNGAGQIEKLLVVIDDRTEQMKLERALAEREAEQSARIEKLYQILNLDPSVFKSFLEEAGRTADVVVEKLALAGSDRSALDLCFREVHTLKGNARALGLDAIAKNAHELEDVLDAIRKEPESPAQDRIASAGELGKKLIAEIQDGGALFDKIVNMKDVFRVKTLDASAEIAERCERIVEQEALAAGKAVAFEFENRAGVLRGDALVRVRAMLGHMIRNAVVHGIETPDARKEKGKAIDGSIRLLMTHHDGQVRIAVEDDGAGLDQERIARHAIDQGILTQEQAGVASPAEVLRLIFRPGFSTAERVTESAGRGVGLDVVEEEARALGGNVRVETKRGTFTKFIVVLPESVLEKRD